MLPNGAIVKSVFTADVIGTAPTDAILIDCSTIDVATAREVEQLAADAGYTMVDAPVSGGIAAAECRHADLHGRRHRRGLRARRSRCSRAWARR